MIGPFRKEARCRTSRRPQLELLEGRALLSGASASVQLPAALAARLSGQVAAQGIKYDPAAVAAIQNALLGRGPGSEFASLIRSQVRNVGSVVSAFLRGKTEFTTAGIAIKIPKWQELYTGTHYDHLTATAAGVVLQRNGQLQLGAVMRGLFDENATSQVVFGIDRGSGAARGPLFANRPGITPDALVTVTVGPYGQSASATIEDLATGTKTEIDASKVIVQGPTVRVFVDPKLLPSRGKAVSGYRFAAWTREGTTGGIESIGSFVPERAMIKIGVQPRR